MRLFRHHPGCQGCGNTKRRLFRVVEQMSTDGSSFAFRDLCRYCLDRLKTVRGAGGDNQWPYTLVMQIDAPAAWLEKSRVAVPDEDGI